jgi:hypothetical protein
MSNEMSTDETRVKDHIREYLEHLKPKMFYFSVPASPLGRAGIADIIGCFNGEFLAIEVKSEKMYETQGHNLSVAQICFKNMVTESGGIWMCVCSTQMLREELGKAFPDEFRNMPKIRSRAVNTYSHLNLQE